METYKRNGLTVTIRQDEDPINPVEDDFNFGTMICNHNRYKLGNEQFSINDYENWDDLAKHLRKERGAAIVLPLGLYEHSGITMYVGSSHDSWDGGQVGFIYATREQVANEFNDDMEAAEKCLRGEVENYDQYLTGDVYGYIVTYPDGTEDSCWNFFGLETAKEAANEIADSFVHPHSAAYAKKASGLHE